MQALMVLVILTGTVAARSVRIDGYGRLSGLTRVEQEAVDDYVGDFNDYDHERLAELYDSLVDGILDTTLSPAAMIGQYIETSVISEHIDFRVDFTPPGVLGYYRPSDSSIVLSNTITNKQFALYVVMHELTHAVQFFNGYYSYGRKTVIINELFADYIASTNSSSIYRQPPYLLSNLYLDWRYEIAERADTQVRVIRIFFDEVTELIGEYYGQDRI